MDAGKDSSIVKGCVSFRIIFVQQVSVDAFSDAVRQYRTLDTIGEDRI